MEKKYELTDETIEVEGHTLYRIRAVRDFYYHYHRENSLDDMFVRVTAGKLGGFVESESNLSHQGACWLRPEAMAYGGARILDNAIAEGDYLRRTPTLIRGAVVKGDSAIKGCVILTVPAWQNNSRGEWCSPVTIDNSIIMNTLLSVTEKDTICCKVKDSVIIGGDFEFEERDEVDYFYNKFFLTGSKIYYQRTDCTRPLTNTLAELFGYEYDVLERDS